MAVATTNKRPTTNTAPVQSQEESVVETDQSEVSGRSQSENAYPLRPRLSFWRPNKANNGAAAFIEINNKGKVFLSMMPQKGGERQFDTDKKITSLLGLTDLGDLIAVCEGLKEQCGYVKDGKWTGLYHQSENGNSITNLARGEKGDVYFLSLSVKRGDDSGRYSVSLSLGDVVLLRELLKDYVRTLWMS